MIGPGSVQPIPGNGKPKIKHTRLRVDHKTAVLAVLEVIADTPMDDNLKWVVTCLKWGENPKEFKPMTYEMTAARFGISVEQVRIMEEAAKYCAMQHLERVDMFGIHSKTQKEGNLVKKLFDHDGKIIIP